MGDGSLARGRSQSALSSDSEHSRRSPKRQATLFDAVAGRVSSHGFIPSESIPSSKYRDTGGPSLVPIKPDEVLFKRENAPERYAETDYYNAHEHLDPRLKLPPADLLTALHAYFSKYYASTSGSSSKKAFRSMDETALSALGILVEESSREVLGETGDLVFLEPREESDEAVTSSQHASRIGSAAPSARDSPLSSDGASSSAMT